MRYNGFKLVGNLFKMCFSAILRALENGPKDAGIPRHGLLIRVQRQVVPLPCQSDAENTFLHH